MQSFFKQATRTDQTGHMRRLICAYVWCTCTFLHVVAHLRVTVDRQLPQYVYSLTLDLGDF